MMSSFMNFAENAAPTADVAMAKRGERGARVNCDQGRRGSFAPRRIPPARGEERAPCRTRCEIQPNTTCRLIFG